MLLRLRLTLGFFLGGCLLCVLRVEKKKKKISVFFFFFSLGCGVVVALFFFLGCAAEYDNKLMCAASALVCWLVDVCDRGVCRACGVVPHPRLGCCVLRIIKRFGEGFTNPAWPWGAAMLVLRMYQYVRSKFATQRGRCCVRSSKRGGGGGSACTVRALLSRFPVLRCSLRCFKPGHFSFSMFLLMVWLRRLPRNVCARAALLLVL